MSLFAILTFYNKLVQKYLPSNTVAGINLVQLEN